MGKDKEQHWRKQLTWGIILTGVGVAFLLDRSGALHWGTAWRYWPLLLVVAGISNLVPPTNVKLVLDGLSYVFFGAWFYCAFEHIWGLTFGNSWPLLLIMWGVTLVLKPVLHNYFESNKEHYDGK
jgi:hypothetical protein